MNKRTKKQIISIIITIILLIIGYYLQSIEAKEETQENDKKEIIQAENISFDLSTIPEYNSNPYVEINNNKPYFTEADYTTEPFEKYSEWDALGRSGTAYANICKETMPKKNEKRGDISSINNLSGWVQKRYDKIIKDKYLYNRCHLIGWQLSAENANKENLITGTRYLNTEGMLPYEDKVAQYIKQNNENHVLYRVTPIFEGTNKLAKGVEMEAWSVEDNGNGVSFNIFCYNVQPGIIIDYETGESQIAE